MRPSNRVLFTISALLCAAVLMAACGGQSPSPTEAEQTDIQREPGAPTAPPTDGEFDSPLEHGLSPLQTPVGEEPGPGAVPLAGEAPQDLLDAVFEDLLERVDVNREAIEIEETGAVIWRDGSLGCPQPGMMYTQALVPGYQIVLRVGDETFDYHTSESGHFVLCEGGLAEEGLPPSEGGGPLVDQ